jgi:WhiB family transcriptional regulator, redox-sensing transcriptional regulator
MDRRPLDILREPVTVTSRVREEFHLLARELPLGTDWDPPPAGPFPTPETDVARPENTMDWRNDAACKDEDPDVFFPIGTTGIAVEQVEDAKRICAQCLVQEPCLEFALASNQDAGVWGGLTEDERRTLKRARQRRRRLVS